MATRSKAHLTTASLDEEAEKGRDVFHVSFGQKSWKCSTVHSNVGRTYPCGKVHWTVSEDARKPEVMLKTGSTSLSIVSQQL